MDDSALDDLYAGDFDGFVPARDELVRILRAQGHRDDADAVRKLRRPTVAAWVVNQLARRQVDEVTALLAAGERLRAAQQAAVAGRGAAELRGAADERRHTLDRLRTAAARLLDETGRGPGALDAVVATFEAATADEELAAVVRAGRLDRERAAAGFGFGDVGELGDVAPHPVPHPETAHAARELRDAERAAAELSSAAEQAESHADELRRTASEATRAARERRTAARKAELAVERLRQRVWELRDREG